MERARINNKNDIVDKGIYTPEESDEDDVVDEVKVYKKEIKKQRESISAEVYGAWNKKTDFKPQVVQKTKEMEERIYSKINQAFMFNSLNQKEKEIVMLAMEEKKFKAGDWVINQGEEGNVLYVIDNGTFDCFKKFSGDDKQTFLKTYQPGESFGELALLYNAPRAASIQAKSDSVLFSLDRQTFNHIVKDASIKKRNQYETILMSWPLLNFIEDPYEKNKIADVLNEFHLKKGESIVKKGDSKCDIYLVASGEILAQNSEGNTVFTFKASEYFGEIPLVFRGKNQPFNFVAAEEDTQVLQVPSGSYDTCLKVAHQKIVSNAEKYQQYL